MQKKCNMLEIHRKVDSHNWINWNEMNPILKPLKTKSQLREQVKQITGRNR